MIDRDTILIAHLRYPTATFNAYAGPPGIDYNRHLEVHNSLLGVLLADQPRTVNPPK
jgi:hypothetical protein